MYTQEHPASNTNIFGRIQFSHADARKHVHNITEKFKTFYASQGYTEHQSVAISSGIDPTVRFVGSHISVFKPYIIEGRIPTPGYFMHQDCIRTQNAKRLLDQNYSPKWGSFFPSLGVISRSERLELVCKEVLDFLRDGLQIADNLIRLRVNSNDTDLLEACHNICIARNIEKDTQKPEYYRHKYGINGVWGRSFNIALHDDIDDNGTCSFSDIGNVIIIEKQEKMLGVEVALGASTILKQLYGLDHINDCHSVPDFKCCDTSIRHKFEDATIVSVVLFREGLRPNASDNKCRILRSYVRSLSYFRIITKMSIDELAEALLYFESHEFPGSEDKVYSDIIDYLTTYEVELANGKRCTPEDKIIGNALGIM
ncbi:MAG: hypothetical protein ABIG90_00340 [bacterium]